MLNINENMTEEEMMEVLSCGIDTAYITLLILKDEPMFYMYLRELDSLDIIGDKIYKLFHYCCKENTYTFHLTMRLFRLGIFSIEEIHENLNLDKPIPFMDYNVQYKKTSNHYFDKINMVKNYKLELRESFNKRK